MRQGVAVNNRRVTSVDRGCLTRYSPDGRYQGYRVGLGSVGRLSKDAQRG